MNRAGDDRPDAEQHGQQQEPSSEQDRRRADRVRRQGAQTSDEPSLQEHQNPTSEQDTASGGPPEPR